VFNWKEVFIMNSKFFTTKGYVISLLPVSILLIVLFFLATIPRQKEAEAQLLSSQDLQTVVAPVALYPDALLSNVLIASTVPDEVVQAHYYLNNYGGQVTSMPATDWEPSVKALLSFPNVLQKMNGDLAWTQTLGYAVINQQPDVMRAIQTYRYGVYNADNLSTNNYQRVSYDNNYVQIMPAVANQYYVPTYNPSTVMNSGNPLADFIIGALVGNWFNYRTTNWTNQNIAVNPAYCGYYNTPSGGYYSGRYANSESGMQSWAPTPRASSFYHNGIVNNTTIINNATTQFQQYQSHHPILGNPFPRTWR
jgi:hypothetical protein